MWLIHEKKWNSFKIADARRQMVLVPSLTIADVMMTWLLLPEIINMLANFLFLSDTLLFEYFSRYCYFEGKL